MAFPGCSPCCVEPGTHATLVSAEAEEVVAPVVRSDAPGERATESGVTGHGPTERGPTERGPTERGPTESEAGSGQESSDPEERDPRDGPR